MTKVEKKKITDLLPDPNNVNKHTQRGHALVENSIRRRGVGRGILAAGKNTEKPIIMAGNLTHEKARDAGINEVIFVHTTGNQLVVTVRDDLDPTSPEAIALGIEDNETAKQSYSPDLDVVAALAAGDNAVLASLRNEDKVFNSIVEGMQPYNVDYEKEWEGMPEFQQENLMPFRTVIVHFKSQEDVNDFSNLISQTFTDKAKFIWHPKAELIDMDNIVYHDES